MKKLRDIELRERALKLLNVTTIYEADEIKRNFRRQIKLVNPNGPSRDGESVPGYSNRSVAKLLIQAYGLLTGRHAPTTMLEDDILLGTLLAGDITPMSQTTNRDEWSATRFYDQFQHSIWPQPSSEDQNNEADRFTGL